MSVTSWGSVIAGSITVAPDSADDPAISVMVRDASELTLYVEDGVNLSHSETQEALSQAVDYMLCVSTIQCRVDPSSRTRRQWLRRLSVVTSADANVTNRTNISSETFVRNDSIVDFSAARLRSAFSVLNQSRDLEVALYDGLLTTSLAHHASQIHLGPAYYTRLSAMLSVAYIGDQGGSTATMQHEVMAALANVSALEVILSGYDIRSSVTLSSWPVLGPSLPPSPPSPPFTPPSTPLASIVEAKAYSGCDIGCGCNRVLTIAIAGSVAASAASVLFATPESAGGGILLPLVMGVQRFQASVALGVSTSPLHRQAAETMGWASGEVSFFAPVTADDSQFYADGFALVVTLPASLEVSYGQTLTLATSSDATVESLKQQLEQVTGINAASQSVIVGGIEASDGALTLNEVGLVSGDAVLLIEAADTTPDEGGGNPGADGYRGGGTSTMPLMRHVVLSVPPALRATFGPTVSVAVSAATTAAELRTVAASVLGAPASAITLEATDGAALTTPGTTLGGAGIVDGDVVTVRVDETSLSKGVSSVLLSSVLLLVLSVAGGLLLVPASTAGIAVPPNLHPASAPSTHWRKLRLAHGTSAAFRQRTSMAHSRMPSAVPPFWRRAVALVLLFIFAAGGVVLFASLMNSSGTASSGTSSRRRSLQAVNGTIDRTPSHAVARMPPQLASLINLLMTAAVSIVVTIAFYTVIICLWQRFVNRRYYREQRAAALKQCSSSSSVQTWPRAAKAAGDDKTDVIAKKAMKAKFFPFPKSLVWPSPLFFAFCIFVTGLTRSSVRLLAAPPVQCGAGCAVVPIIVLSALVAFLLSMGIRLETFLRLHRSNTPWKPAAKPTSTSSVTDPYLRLLAVIRVQAFSFAVVAKQRAPSLRRLNSRRSVGHYETQANPVSSEDGFRERVAAPVTSTAAGVRTRCAFVSAADSSSPPPSPPQREHATPVPSMRNPPLLPQRQRRVAPMLEQRSLVPASLAQVEAETAEALKHVPLSPRSQSLMDALEPGGSFNVRHCSMLARQSPSAPSKEVVTADMEAQIAEAMQYVSLSPRSRSLMDALAPDGAAMPLGTAQISALPHRDGFAKTPPPAVVAAIASLTAIRPPARTESHDWHQTRLPLRPCCPSPGVMRMMHLETKLTLKQACNVADQQAADHTGLVVCDARFRPHRSSLAPNLKLKGSTRAAPRLVTSPRSCWAQPRSPWRVVPIAASSSGHSVSSADAQELSQCMHANACGTSGSGSSRSSARPSLSEVRAQTTVRLAAQGSFRDRRAGAFGVPEADAKEPERTERLLASPFALCRPRAGDALHGLEGFLMFRVNGSSRVGVSYRVLIVLVNMTFGLLAGLQPLLPEGSAGGLAQTSLILILQLGMCFICFKCFPDADMIVSTLSGAQYGCEALATAALVGASVIAPVHDSSRTPGDTTTMGIINLTTNQSLSAAGDAEGAPSASEAVSQLQAAGFVLWITAISIPIVQLLEQRALTPIIKLVVQHNASPTALLASAYMLFLSLPKRLALFFAGLEANDDNEAGTTTSCGAAEDAEETFETTEDDAGDGSLIDPGDEVAEQDTVHEMSEAGGQDGLVGVSGTEAADAVAHASKLLARGLAANEAGAKTLAGRSNETASAASFDGLYAGHRWARQSVASRRRAMPLQKDEAVDDVDDDADDGAADD